MAELPIGNKRFQIGYRLTPVIKALIISNVAIFILSFVFLRFLKINLWETFGLVPAKLWGNGMVWQPVTYLFFHGGISHLLFNMLWLWMFGGELEGEWGKKQFLIYYFICGIVAGLIVSLLYPHSTTPGIGASGAILGILTAYGLMYSERQIFFMFFPMKVKHLIWILIATNIWTALGFSCGKFGALGHLGGALAGFVYLKIIWRLQKTRYKIINPKTTKDRFSKIEFDKHNHENIN